MFYWLKTLQFQDGEMKPRRTRPDPQGDLFRPRLEHMVDPSQELVRLANRIDWQGLEDRFEPL